MIETFCYGRFLPCMGDKDACFEVLLMFAAEMSTFAYKSIGGLCIFLCACIISCCVPNNIEYIAVYILHNDIYS